MDNLTISDISIKNMIYELRGVQVMLDSDLAKLYGVETKRINEAVSRNKNKFCDDYSWIVSNNEKNILWSQNATANINSKSRANPRVFTEKGIYMLATILKSKTAVEVTKRLIDTFVDMRHYINYNQLLLPHRVSLLENKVDELFDMFNPKDITKDKMFFEGEFYDSYSFLMDIFNKAEDEIIIFDNYAGKELLDILKNINKRIIIVSKNMTDVLIKKYNKQYNNIVFIKNDSFHDRYLIIDRNRLFLCGASFKDLGKKCFSITESNDKDNLSKMIEMIFK